MTRIKEKEYFHVRSTGVHVNVVATDYTELSTSPFSVMSLVFLSSAL